MIYNTINDAQTVAGSGEGALLANRYRVVRQLGQGDMGSVWLAEDTQLDNKPFAIKMLLSGCCTRSWLPNVNDCVLTGMVSDRHH